MPGTLTANAAYTALSSGAREFVPTRTVPTPAAVVTPAAVSSTLSAEAREFVPGGGPAVPSSEQPAVGSSDGVAAAAAPATTGAPMTWAMRAKLSAKAMEFVPRGVAPTPAPVLGAWAAGPGAAAQSSMAPVHYSTGAVAPVPVQVGPTGFVFDPLRQSSGAAPSSARGAAPAVTEAQPQPMSSKPWNTSAQEFTPGQLLPAVAAPVAAAASVAVAGARTSVINLSAFADSDDESEEESQPIDSADNAAEPAAWHAMPAKSWGSFAMAEYRASAARAEAAESSVRQSGDIEEDSDEICADAAVAQASGPEDVHEPSRAAAASSNKAVPDCDSELRLNGLREEPALGGGSEEADDEASPADIDSELAPSATPEATGSSSPKAAEPWSGWKREAADPNDEADTDSQVQQDEAAFPRLGGVLPRKVVKSRSTGGSTAAAAAGALPRKAASKAVVAKQPGPALQQPPVAATVIETSEASKPSQPSKAPWAKASREKPSPWAKGEQVGEDSATGDAGVMAAEHEERSDKELSEVSTGPPSTDAVDALVEAPDNTEEDACADEDMCEDEAKADAQSEEGKKDLSFDTGEESCEEEDDVVTPRSHVRPGAETSQVHEECFESPVSTLPEEGRGADDDRPEQTFHSESDAPSDANSFTTKELLRWQAAAIAENLRDEDVCYSVDVATPKAHGEASFPTSPRASKAGGWREDAARAQKASRSSRGEESSRKARTRTNDDKEISRDLKAVQPLEVSENSWLAQQREFKAKKDSDKKSDVEVEREMKLILNKLTIERFDTLYQQLIACGIESSAHVEILMREVFDKATTQHHFIGMYAELCTQLHKWFIDPNATRHTATAEDGRTFKKILLNQCQQSFEQHLRPQTDEKEDEEAATARKNRMLGNLRFVGALLEKGMLASKISMAIVEELLADPTAVSMECLCVFLTSIGPSFDKKEWVHHVQLRAAFQKVQSLVNSDKQLPSRVRFLMQDVLDLRASGWQNKKKAVQSNKGPMTLEAVHRQAEQELGGRIDAGNLRTYSTQSSTPLSRTTSSQESSYERRRETSSSTPSRSISAPQPSTFDAKRFRNDFKETLRELSRSLDVDAAYERIRVFAVPADKQASELCELISMVSDLKSAESREASFKLLAKFFLVKDGWRRTALVDGLTRFFGEIYEDLKMDCPALPSIIREELAPALQGLVEAGHLRPDVLKGLLAVV